MNPRALSVFDGKILIYMKFVFIRTQTRLAPFVRGCLIDLSLPSSVRHCFYTPRPYQLVNFSRVSCLRIFKLYFRIDSGSTLDFSLSLPPVKKIPMPLNFFRIPRSFSEHFPHYQLDSLSQDTRTKNNADTHWGPGLNYLHIYTYQVNNLISITSVLFGRALS